MQTYNKIIMGEDIMYRKSWKLTVYVKNFILKHNALYLNIDFFLYYFCSDQFIYSTFVEHNSEYLPEFEYQSKKIEGLKPEISDKTKVIQGMQGVVHLERNKE